MTKLATKILGKKTYKLKRALGLFNVTLAGVGIILGAGIYALIGIAAREAGNATWLSFLIAAVVAAFTGFSYAELSSFFKGDAGEYDYCKKAFHKKLAWIIAILIIFTGVVSASTVALGFAGYLSSLISAPFLWSAIGMIILTSLVNFYGIKESSFFNTVSTTVEFLGLLCIIALGIYYIFSGKSQISPGQLFEFPKHAFGVFQAAALVFFAYMGFETIIKLREETDNPNKNIPKALLSSIAITSVIYVLVAIAAVVVLPYGILATSNSPLADVAASSLGAVAFLIIGIIALFSTSNTVLLTMVTTSRLVYGIAKEDGSLPRFLARVHKKRQTPHLAVAVIGILTILLTLGGDIELVAHITTTFLFITFALVNIATIFIRYKVKTKRPFKMPLNIGKFPVLSALGVLTSLFMLIFSMINLF